MADNSTAPKAVKMTSKILGIAGFVAFLVALSSWCTYFYVVNKATGFKGPGFSWAAAGFAFFIIQAAITVAQHVIYARYNEKPASYTAAQKYVPTKFQAF